VPDSEEVLWTQRKQGELLAPSWLRYHVTYISNPASGLGATATRLIAPC
jgi:hypothetical protein